MTFTEWYKQNHHDEWHEDYTELYMFADECTTKYEEWCKENGVTTVFDG